MKRPPLWDQSLRDVRRVTAAGRRTECRAYQLWDGFDDYDTTHELWDVQSSTQTYSSAYARFPAAPNCSGQGVRMPGGVNSYKTKNLNSSQARMLFGFAVLFESLPGSGYRPFLGFYDNGTIQSYLCYGSDGSLAHCNSSNSPIVISAPGVIGPNRFYWMDIDVTINNASGIFKLYLSTAAGGAALISATGINNRNTANNYMTQFRIGDLINGGFTGRFDDFHAHDATGSAPNTILGEGTRIYTKMPTGAGYATTLTPNGAGANWQCVDEVPPDDDTTYVSASSFPLTEGYAIGAAGFTGSVNGVVRRSRIRKDDASAHTFQNGVRSSGVNALATAVAVQSAYGWVDSFSANDPNTSAAWTAGGSDAAQPIISAAS